MIEVFSVADMRAAEANLFASGVPSFNLMQRAGLAAADIIHTSYPSAQKICVLCGPGNNGGDGWMIATALAILGHAVDVMSLVPREALGGDAARAAAGWTGAVSHNTLQAGTYDLIVDALFGIGLTRPLKPDAVALIRSVNTAARHGAIIIAIDLPSGIDADTGAVRGCAVRATETIAFHRQKQGHVLEPGRMHAGYVRTVDIGIPAPAGHLITTNAPTLWQETLPRLTNASHKYTRGHAMVLAGGLEGVGAARLAARAALRIGAGLVTIGCQPEAHVAHASRGPDALITRAIDGQSGLDALLADTRRNALLIGPAYGLGDATRRAIEHILATSRPTVLDADALTAFAGAADVLARLINGQVVLTPHAGEFTRLFGADEISSKVSRTLTAARTMNAVIVHKGPDTVIAAPDGRAAVNINGTSLLATAGTGDVLAGMITGLLAQGMPPFEASCAAVYRHAATAHRLGTGLIADDLADACGVLQ